MAETHHPPVPQTSDDAAESAQSAQSSGPGAELRQTISVGGTDATTPVEPNDAGAGSGQAFTDGERIAGRYLVVRLIGSGGMGEVYEVEDLELRMRVALKTIRAGVAHSELALERFKREILLARKVTHPDVGRIFDLGQHTRPGRFAAINFFTMELLAGESLAERLTRGPLSIDEARPLLAQMAAALDAAHAAGVVHRDFKSANVMLVPGKAGQLRAVVTDFGMARSTVAGDARITGTGGLLGTPAYMAPEQIADGDVGPAADVYALGVVAFEMVTGKLPFVGKSALEAATKRLSQPVPSPRALLPALDPRWDAAIMRAMAREPEERFTSAGAFARALDRSAPRRRPWSWVLVVLVGMGMAGMTAPLVLRAVARRTRAMIVASATSPNSPVAVVVEPRRALALLGFKNLAGSAQAQWLSTALSEMLGVELAASPELRTIPSEHVEHTKQALKIVDGQELEADALAQVAKALGVRYVVAGSYLELGDGASAGLRLDIRIVDAKTGETITVLTEEGTIEGLLPLVSRAGKRLRQKLGGGAPSSADDRALRAALPSTSEAARLYAEGLDKRHHFDIRAAQKLLSAAADRDPDNALIRADLATADSQLGMDTEARAQSERAMQHAQLLPREQRLLVEANDDELHFQWAKAVKVYQALRVFYPDNLDYGVRYGWAQVSAGASSDALQTAAELHAQPHSDDIEVELYDIEASAHEKLSNWKEELDAANKSATAAEAIHAPLGLARARRSQAWALLRLGKPAEALTAAEDCRRIFADAGNPWGEAQGYNMIGNVESSQGHFDAAERAFSQSLKVAQTAGDLDGQATALNNLAAAYMDSSQLTRAEPLFLQVVAISRRTGDRAGLAYTLSDLATLYSRLDRYAEAVKALEESNTLFRQTGDQLEAAIGTGDLAALHRTMGDTDLSRGEHRDALTGFLATHDEAHAAYERLELATLDVDDGELAHSRTAITDLVTQFARTHAARDEAIARTVLARIALASGQLDEAERQTAQALTVATTTCDDDARPCIDAQIMNARIALARGGKSDAVAANRALATAQAAATKRRDVPRSLEIGIVRATTQHDPEARRRDLTTVEKTARTLGFLRLARRAAATRDGEKMVP